jgi:hypothetical protein
MMTFSYPRLLLQFGCIALGGSLLALRWPAAHDTPADPAAFVAEARIANRRYESQREAIDDGFKRVGVEFPAMGEHWVSFGRVMEDSFAASRPSVLIYVNVAGEPRLAGVAYTKLLTAHDEPPAFPFAGAWHEHSGAVDEESLPMRHVHSSGVESNSPRLSILHVWAFMPNPDGVFTTDNWALPLVKLGVAASTGDRSAVRALALAQDEDEYHRLVVRTMLKLDDREDSTAARVIESHRVRAEQDAAVVRASRQLTRETEARLSGTWSDMWAELERALPAHATDLRSLRASM